MSAALDRLRQPEHTGDNRCTRCTAVNVAVAAVVSAAVAVVHPAAGLAALSLALAAIYLRGYLVPMTPRLTARYLPPDVHAYFDGGHPTETEVDVESILVENDVASDGADVSLTPGFQRAFDEALAVDVESLDVETLARTLDTDPRSLEIKSYAGTPMATTGGEPVARWESEAALIADAAAAEALEDQLDGWEELPATARSNLALAVRSLLDRCPVCDATLELSEQPVESCCSSRRVYSLSCVGCGQRVVELPGDG
ncbi:MAG: hypothetical protein ACLFMT_02805 [Halobacteriales archaeon]